MSFKIIVAGGRSFENRKLLFLKMDKYLKDITDEIEIVNGKAKGADFLGGEYAKERGYKAKEFPADWGQYGNSAGFIRNRQMSEYADALVLFWDGFSKGSKSMLELAKAKGLKIRVVKY